MTSQRLLQALEPWAKWARGRAVFGVRAETPESVASELLAAFEAEPDNEPRFRVGDEVLLMDPDRPERGEVIEVYEACLVQTDPNHIWMARTDRLEPALPELVPTGDVNSDGSPSYPDCGTDGPGRPATSE